MRIRQCSRPLLFAVALLFLAGCPWCPTEPLLKADFQATPVAGTAPLEVAFTDASTSRGAPVTAWAWNFGDGGSSTEQNPRHTYQRVGKYTVLLQVQSADGFDVRSRRDLIDVAQPTIVPEARFRAEPVQGAAPLRVSFRDQSLPGSHAISAWAWDFGDGETSDDRHPVHVYSDPGTYPVSLTVQTSAGQHTLTKPTLIEVEAAPVPVSFASPALETLVRGAVQQPDGGLVESQVSGLETLSGQGLGISELAGLEYCAALETLDLGDNGITDLGPLSNLLHLAWLNLEDNAISDLAPLLANPAFGSGAMLWLRGNPLGQEALCVQIPALEARGVQVDFDGECAGPDEGELEGQSGGEGQTEGEVEGQNEGELEGQVEGQIEGEVEMPVMTLRREVVPGQACNAGAALDLVVTLSYDGAAPVTALGLVETLPDGWTFGEVIGGPAPANVLERPSGEVEFLWIEIPGFPMQLRYQIVAPLNTLETNTISGVALYRLDGPELHTNTETTSFQCEAAAEEGQAEGNLEGENEGSVEGEGEGLGPVSDYIIPAQFIAAPYTPGQTLDVTVRLDYVGEWIPLEAVALNTWLPPGWTYQGLISNQWPLPLRLPHEDPTHLFFLWVGSPGFPYTLTYRLLAPATATGPQTFVSQVGYQQNQSVELYSPIVKTTVLPAPAEEGEPQEGEGTTEGEGFIEGEGEGTGAEHMFLTQTVSGPYTPGMPLDVTVTLDYTDPETAVMAVGLMALLPPLWSYQGLVSGQLPPIRPNAGTQGELGFMWIDVPLFPVTFTYRVLAPESASGPQILSGQILYRLSGPELNSAPVQTTVLPSDALEGQPEEGEGAAEEEGVFEGTSEGTVEGSPEGEGGSEGALEGEGDGTLEGEGEGAMIYDMVLDRVIVGGYVPGQTLDVTLTLTYTGASAVTAVGVYEFLPPGWTFMGFVSGDLPPVRPNTGGASPLQFAWIQPPAFPTSFTYRVRAPEDAAGPQMFLGLIEYRIDGPPLISEYTETTLWPMGTYEGEGQEIPEGENEGEGTIHYGMVLGRETPAPYVPSETVDVTVIMRYAGSKPVSALGLREFIPEAWSFAGLVSGDLPELKPVIGAVGKIEFAWISPPDFPAAFTYRLHVPAGASPSAGISGITLYRTDGPELTSNPCITQLVRHCEFVPIGDYALLQDSWSYQWDDTFGASGGVTWTFYTSNCRDSFRTQRSGCEPDCWTQTDFGWYELDESAHLITFITTATCSETHCNIYPPSDLVSTISYAIEGDQLILGTEILQRLENKRGEN